MGKSRYNAKRFDEYDDDYDQDVKSQKKHDRELRENRHRKDNWFEDAMKMEDVKND